MKLEFAQKIKKAADVMGYEISLRDNYSGRGMYGRTTVALVGNHCEIVSAMVAAAYDMGHNNEDADFAERFIEAMGELSVDSMGKDDKVVY